MTAPTATTGALDVDDTTPVVGAQDAVKDGLTPDRPSLPGASDGAIRPGSRLDRLRRPRAKDVLRDTAVSFGVCVKPVLLRRLDMGTGETAVIEVDCGSTREAVCPPCAAKARRLRAQQCREGWHLVEEPDLTPDPATQRQKQLLEERAHITAAHAQAVEDGDHELAAVVADALAEVDADLAKTGARGTLTASSTRRVRSTKRRGDVPDLPRTPATRATVGRVYTDPKTGREFRPSLFVTLTLPSYGAVLPDGTPVRPTTYDYAGAARDALHFGKLLDRFAQNLRRVAGYEAQYFAAVEPQKRGAPHAHYAIRGTLPRALVKQVIAATYVNIWWPATDHVIYDGADANRLPVWDETADDGRGAYTDPVTGEPLMTWAQALDQLDQEHEALEATGQTPVPSHTVRFGTQADVRGVLAGSPEAERAIGYLVKYLVKDLGDDLGPTNHYADPAGGDSDDQADELDRDGVQLADVDDVTRARHRRDTAHAKASRVRRADHIDRLVTALRFEPCSPRCANWLRYGIQPKSARAGMRPGCCKNKAHRPSHLGYGGRRVLVSRKWTGKDLADHRHDRKAHVLAVLGRAPDGTVTSGLPLK